MPEHLTFSCILLILLFRDVTSIHVVSPQNSGRSAGTCIRAIHSAGCSGNRQQPTSTLSPNQRARPAKLATQTRPFAIISKRFEIRADWEEGWWYLGTLEYDADRFSDAIPALQKVVQLDPAFGPAWNFLGLCEFETHDYENSLAHLQKGQQLGTGDDPEIARVSAYHLALLLNRNGEFSQAASLLSQTFAENPPSDVKGALGLALLRVPLLPQEVDPSQDALVHSAGETASLLARGDSAKAIDSFRSLLNQYPERSLPALCLWSRARLRRAECMKHSCSKRRS